MRDLIVGLLNIVLIAMALGKYPALAEWARREAFKPMKSLPVFFSGGL